MVSGGVEVITSIERRRRWSAAEKEELVAATLEPGGSVSGVARAAGIHPSQLYGWRRQLCRQGGLAPGFAAVRVMVDAASVGQPGCGVIEIEFAGGRMRITGTPEPATVTAAVKAEAAAQLAAERAKSKVNGFERRKPARRPFPAHLPRERIVYPSPSTCPCCGGRLQKLREDVTATLELVPRRWKVIGKRVVDHA